jgi:hypothetical protein
VQAGALSLPVNARSSYPPRRSATDGEADEDADRERNAEPPQGRYFTASLTALWPVGGRGRPVSATPTKRGREAQRAVYRRRRSGYPDR